MTNFTNVSFDIISDIKKCFNINQIHDILERSSSIFGYNTFVIAEAPVKSRDCLQDRLMLARWPAEWSDRYGERGYIHHDPVVAHTRRMTCPFKWSEAPVRRDERLARIIMGEAAEIGLKNGYCIPVHDFNCTRIISFGGSHFDLPEHAATGLHMIGIYADLTLQSLAPAAVKRIERQRGTPRCSPREIECIQWAAAGKTGWETSEILSLSHRTVEDYLNTAAQKLGATNRVHLVAKALRQGIID
ncbi:LuxR family transcriptional regulator [Methylobacterium tarhaniae]|uniref:LuxR family transcriptional regulator n=1 Tax=Methylobacterium tarhaniae TaxID=1187852 RepID=UPI0009F8862F|nr:LuxR family transcriptional regulator [Methylobacterium tarhaniae]